VQRAGQPAQDVSLAEPVADLAVDVLGLLQYLGRGREVTGLLSHGAQEEQGVGLAELPAEAAVDVPGLLQRPGRAGEVAGVPPRVP
jgi:hypothetical protein